MRLYSILAIFSLVAALPAAAQSEVGSAPGADAPRPFPSPESVLRDAKHKEPKSGVQLQGGQLTIASGVGTPTAINSLSFSNDGRLLAAGKDFGRLVLWDVREKKFLRAIDTGQGQVKAVAVRPDGQVVATGGNQDGNSVKLWDVQSGRMLWRFAHANGEIKALFFAQGNRLIVSDNASDLYVLDSTEGKAVNALTKLNAVTVSGDGDAMITTDGTEVAVWNINNQTKVRSTPITNKFSLFLAANLSADRFAVFERRVVKVGELSTGKTLIELPNLVPKSFTWRPDFAAFSPEGSVAYLSIDSRLKIIDVKTGIVCGGPTMYSGAAALSPDGLWFAAAKDDSILSQERTDGVWIWSTKTLLQKCGSNSPPGDLSR